MKNGKNSFLRSTALVTLAAILTKLLGFVRETMLAHTYAASAVVDAFVVAFTLPGVVLTSIGASASAAFIPVYYRTASDRNKFTNNVINNLSIIGLAFTLVFAAFPQGLVFLFASQLEQETFNLAASFLRIILISSVPLLLMDIFRAYLQIHDAFFFASVVGVVNNLFVIPSIPLSKAYLPILPMGVAVGYFFCLVALVLKSKRFGFTYQPYLNPKDEELKHLIRALLPVFLALGIAEINQIVDRNFASSLPTGAIACLNYASRVSGMVTMLIGAAIVTVLFPKMSERAKDGDNEAVKHYLSECVRKLYPILFPATVGTMILARPVIRLLFEHGAFTPENTVRTAECLQMYALAFFLNSANPLLVRAFYAMNDTKKPAFCSVFSVGCNILLNILLVGTLQHRGLALATSSAACVSLLLLSYHLRKAIGPLGLFGKRKEVAKTLLATLTMGAAVWGGYQLLPVMESGTLRCALYTAALAGLGIITYGLLHGVLRTSFFKECTEMAQKLIKKAKKT